MSTTYFPSAIDQYFKAGDAAKQACAYLRQRPEDAAALCSELTFKLDPHGRPVLQAEVYGHRLLLNAAGGGGYIETHRGCFSFTDTAQALAYILAAHW